MRFSEAQEPSDLPPFSRVPNRMPLASRGAMSDLASGGERNPKAELPCDR